MKLGNLVFLTSLISMILCIFCGVFNAIVAGVIGDPVDVDKNPYIRYWGVLVDVFFYITIGFAIIGIIAKIKNKSWERS
jgi:hypothetical protein